MSKCRKNTHCNYGYFGRMGCKFLPKHKLSVENLTTLPVSTSTVGAPFQH